MNAENTERAVPTAVVPYWSKKKEETPDMVSSPPHYTQGGIECIDAIESAIGSVTDPVAAFLIGQVIKYSWRFEHKGKPHEDLKKARWYLDRLIKRYEKKEKSDEHA